MWDCTHQENLHIYMEELRKVEQILYLDERHILISPLEDLIRFWAFTKEARITGRTISTGGKPAECT